MNFEARSRPPVFIAHEIYRLSRYGSAHPLSIPRVSTVVDLCRALGWLPEERYIESPMASAAQLARFHDPAYIAALQKAEQTQDAAPEVKARHNIGVNNNPIYPEMFRRPATACGGSILAADLVKDGGIVHHPPGGTHHGRRNRASGFCYFNDPVLGLRRLLDLGIAPVLYVDLDAHHGDGVQDAFHADDRVFTISIHEENRWPRTGPVEDRAGGAARNLPVPRGFNDSELNYLIEHAVVPLAERLDPAAIMIQCGCDGLEDDPQARMSLSNRGYWQAVSVLKGLARRVIVLGGGGYNPWAVARCWSGVWATLNGHPIPEALTAPAESVLRELWWSHRRGRNPPEHWFTTLADTPNPGPVRETVREVARKVLDAPGRRAAE